MLQHYTDLESCVHAVARMDEVDEIPMKIAEFG